MDLFPETQVRCVCHLQEVGSQLDVFATFKKWKAKVKNLIRLKIKCLKSDNGGEYDKLEFKAFCVDEGIQLMRTIPNKAR